MIHPGKIPIRLGKIFAELDSVSGNLRLFNPAEFEKWLDKSCNDIVEQLIVYQRSLPQTEKEYLLKLSLERLKCLVLPAKAKPAYVFIWNSLVNELVSKLKSFIFIIHLTSVNNPVLGKEHRKIEFRSGITVAVLAALTRVHFESNLYQTTNKRELCRQALDSYCTANIADIGATSFKMQFDYPTLEALNQIESNLLKQTKIVKTLKKEVIRRDDLNK